MVSGFIYSLTIWAAYNSNEGKNTSGAEWSFPGSSRAGMKLLLIQPGRFGDIIICLPIAKYYHEMDYEVYWPIHSSYLTLFDNIDYVKPVLIERMRLGAASEIYRHMAVNSYDKIIDLAIGYDGTADYWWEKHKGKFDSFVKYKYYISGVPLKERWALDWERNRNKEDALYNRLVKEEPYDLVHNETHIGRLFEHGETRPVIYFRPVEGFNVFDWYRIVIGAREIHCIDSLLANFVETINGARDIRKYMYFSVRNPDEPVVNSFYRNNWENR